MSLFTPGDPRPIHFMGIAGAGMSALALVARRRGLNVTGCDTDLRNAADVMRAGAEVFAGHDPAHVRGARAVVHTSAVPREHAELQAAVAQGVPVVRRADALGELVNRGKVIAVAGTHGKTTTTAMVAETLVAGGFRLTSIVGGRVASWGGNSRFEGEELFVVEADEYDRSFLALQPTVAVVNNVEADHLECYGGLAALEDAFAEFAGRAERVLVGADDPGARRVGEAVGVPTWRVGTATDADVRIEDIVQETGASHATVVLPGGHRVNLQLPLPGRHNVRNAAMTLAVGYALDADIDCAVAALATFGGVERRFQLVGTRRGVTVIDDYAHHPTEIAATLAAARQRFPAARLIAVFQPHLYSRTQRHAVAFGAALAQADVVVVTEVYPAREQPIAGVSGRLVADAAHDAGAQKVDWIPARTDVAARLARWVRDGDVVLTLGAGDITETAGELLARLAGAAA